MPIYDREKQRIRGWMRWRERGRHKGVDKVAIAHGTQLHAPPRSLCLSLSLSPPLARFLPSFAPSSSSFSSLDHSTHTLHFASLLFTSLLFSSLLFSSRFISSSLLSSALFSSRSTTISTPNPQSKPLPLFGFPGTVHNRLIPNLPLSPGNLRRDDSKQEISQTIRRQRCSCREFLACFAVSTNFDSPFAFGYRSRSFSNIFSLLPPFGVSRFPINSWKLLLVETRSIGKSFKNRFGTRLFVMDSSPCP